MKKRRKNKISKRKQFSFLTKIRSLNGKKIIQNQRRKNRNLNVKYGLIKSKIKKGWAHKNY